MWQKLKPEKPIITIKWMTEPNVAIMVETHSELNTSTIEVDNQIAIIQVLVEDVLIDGRANVNIIIENL